MFLESQKAVVSPADGSKPLRSAAALKQRRYRLRRDYENSGEALLFTECRHCSAPIKPSYKRGFCPGGACREQFFRDVQVRRVIPITAAMRSASENLLISEASRG
jgi:hypothetical protein